MSPLTRSTRTRPTAHPLLVDAVEPAAAEGAVAISLVVPEELAAAYLRLEAGQHVTLDEQVDGRRVRQSYSVWTSPARVRAERRLRIAVATVPDGRLSPWLAGHVRAGDTLHVLPPAGEMVLQPPDPDPGRGPILAVAGGSGITPILAITAAALERGERVLLVRTDRTRARTVLAGEVEGLRAAYPDRLAVAALVSREERVDAPARPGRLTPDTLRELLSEHDLSASGLQGAYLCGPPGLVAMLERTLRADGTPPERVLHEVFFTDGNLADG